MNKDNIRLNPALRSVSKSFLVSLWGKMGQRENQTQTEVVTEPERLLQLLTSPEIVVNSVLPVNDETLYVGWCYAKEAVVASSMTNVVIAAFTTAQARLKLFEVLHVLSARCLYYDTDSVCYIYDPLMGHEQLPTGTILGELTDELAGKGVGTYIKSFVSGGPKFYAYEYVTPEGTTGYVCKIKGVKLYYSNSQRLNYESIRRLVAGEDENAISVEGPAIRRTVFHEVITQNESKTCRVVCEKRRFVSPYSSLPFGYKSDQL